MGRRVDKLRAGLAIVRVLAGGFVDAALTFAGRVQHGSRKRSADEQAVRDSGLQDELAERYLREREERNLRWP